MSGKNACNDGNHFGAHIITAIEALSRYGLLEVGWSQ